MAKGVVIDFSNVEEGGFNLPDGEYIVKVKKIEQKTSQSSGAPYFNWELMVIQGVKKGTKVFHITSLKEAALFNLRNTLIACGIDVPKGKMSMDIKSLIGKVMGVTTVNEEYEGKKRPKIKETWPVVKNGNEYDRFDPDAESIDDEDMVDDDNEPIDDDDVPF